MDWINNTPAPRPPPLQVNNPCVMDIDPPHEENKEYDGLFWFNEVSSQMWFNNHGVWKSYQTLQNINIKN